MTKNWFVYIVKCCDGTLYTGVTNDLDERVKQHNLGKGAKYTRARKPVNLIYSEKCDSRSTALKREAEIKKLTRAQKQALIVSPPQSNSDS